MCANKEEKQWLRCLSSSFHNLWSCDSKCPLKVVFQTVSVSVYVFYLHKTFISITLSSSGTEEARKSGCNVLHCTHQTYVYTGDLDIFLPKVRRLSGQASQHGSHVYRRRRCMKYFSFCHVLLKVEKLGGLILVALSQTCSLSLLYIRAKACTVLL